ncbi:AraC-like DNA-binding protein [Luteococcus japonicus]|uniref:AraC-like DNA-binding protein n=2 Tax=Luteococcus japonicus TaxID=33984 RepID=A0A3N1ZPS5_9ACTN|nr:AraC-like DNA-binding protein [Luteococcus japonicus]ROR56026.1 AraC-like DNA-binding protein [Luteococcus japonicus]
MRSPAPARTTSAASSPHAPWPGFLLHGARHGADRAPHSRFGIPYGLLEQMTVVRLGGDAGLGRIVSPFLSQLVAGLDDLSGPAGTRLVHNTVDLLQTLLTNELDVTRTAASPHWALLQQIRDHIDEHLGSPGLSPSSIATANFISTRRLHNVFLEQGMTVSAYVRSRRLERCHQDLVDPAQRYTPVAVIGARSGFTDAAHFSLTFKAAHTESPAAALRRRGRGDG